jgi:translocation and assembly module TamA
MSTASMQRVKGSAAYYFTPEVKKYGTLIVRGDLGYVRVSDDLDAPTSLLFRTGGGNTVRGYEYNSIGMDGENGAVLGGKAMAVMSAEYQIPIKKDYALAVFHDHGTVANDFKDIKWRSSSGVGFRWFSPFAPIAFDIAYAHERKKIGWQLNLGTRF